MQVELDPERPRHQGAFVVLGSGDRLTVSLLGFEDQHLFSPPFGYYDRDYPGFAIEVIERP